MSAGARTERLAAPDALRVAAIFIVGWFHIWQQSWLDPGFRIGNCYVNLQQVVRHGYMMVDIMLLLSGFLLALPVARQGEQAEIFCRPGRYCRKRFWRIAPSYYLCIMLTTVLYAIPRGLYSTPGFMAKDLLMHATFTHTLSYDTYLLSPTAATLWTLSVEVLFYALWPAVARLFRRRPGETCLGMTVIALAFRLYVSSLPETSFLFNQLPAQLDLYACGMAAAWVLVRLERDGRPGPRTRRWLSPVGMVLTLALMCQIMYWQPVSDYPSIRMGQMIWRLPLGLLGGAFLVCGCLAPPALARAVGNPVTRFLADISYNFYIWHQFLACRLKDWRIPPYAAEQQPNMAYEQPWQTQYTLLCFLGVAALCALITYGFEKPIQRWALRRGGKRRPPSHERIRFRQDHLPGGQHRPVLSVVSAPVSRHVAHPALHRLGFSPDGAAPAAQDPLQGDLLPLFAPRPAGRAGAVLAGAFAGCLPLVSGPAAEGRSGHLRLAGVPAAAGGPGPGLRSDGLPRGPGHRPLPGGELPRGGKGPPLPGKIRRRAGGRLLVRLPLRQPHGRPGRPGMAGHQGRYRPLVSGGRGLPDIGIYIIPFPCGSWSKFGYKLEKHLRIRQLKNTRPPV